MTIFEHTDRDGDSIEVAVSVLADSVLVDVCGPNGDGRNVRVPASRLRDWLLERFPIEGQPEDDDPELDPIDVNALLDSARRYAEDCADREYGRAFVDYLNDLVPPTDDTTTKENA